MIAQILLFFISIFSSLFSNHSSELTLHNMTDYDLRCAYYYVHNNHYQRTGEIYSLPHKESTTIPKATVPHSILAVDYISKNLPLSLDQLTWNTIAHKTFDWHNILYIHRLDGILKIYTFLEWYIIAPLWNVTTNIYTTLSYPFTYSAEHILIPIVTNPHKDHIAHVRDSIILHPSERRYRTARNTRACAALSSLSNIDTPTNIPTIAIAFSGGGLRAALGTIGFLSGLEQTKMLDLFMYGLFVSGASWGYMGLTVHGGPLSLYKEHIIKAVSRGIAPKSIEELKLIMEALLVKIVMNQPVTVSDIFGTLLANMLFYDAGKEKQRLYLSRYAHLWRDGSWLMPLYAAIRADNLCLQPFWYECNPYEFGSTWLSKYIPLWSFGRTFVDGQSNNFAPEQSMGSLLGLFGSAFAAQLQEIYQAIESSIESDETKNLLANLISPVAHQRLSYAEVNNFTIGLYKHIIPNNEFLRLADAGTEPGSHFAYPLVSNDRPERRADIIIFCDMTVHTTPGKDLIKAANYARQHGYTFPLVYNAEINNSSISIFQDNNPECPTIIYVRLWNDPALKSLLDLPEYTHYKNLLQNFDVTQCSETGSCSTYNFKYTKEDAQKVVALAEFLMHAHKETILKQICAVYEKKRMRT